MNDKPPINIPHVPEDAVLSDEHGAYERIRPEDCAAYVVGKGQQSVSETYKSIDCTPYNNFDLFEEVLTNRLYLARQVLGAKGKEYAAGTDRFANFRQAAIIQGTTPEKALLGMMVKHEVSTRDIVNDLDVKLPTVALLEEKIGDWINYLILLEGMIKERINKRTQEAVGHGYPI